MDRVHSKTASLKCSKNNKLFKWSCLGTKAGKGLRRTQKPKKCVHWKNVLFFFPDRSLLRYLPLSNPFEGSTRFRAIKRPTMINKSGGRIYNDPTAPTVGWRGEVLADAHMGSSKGVGGGRWGVSPGLGCPEGDEGGTTCKSNLSVSVGPHDEFARALASTWP